MFGNLLTRADHKVRMDQRFYADDVEAGMRAATRLGGDDLAIGRARAAVIKRLNNAKALLDAVPASARHDPGYIFSRVQWLRKDNKLEEAGKLILTVPQDPAAMVDPDQWWQERRILVRKLLDDGDPRTAFYVARDAAQPVRGYFRADHYFTAGWIALRFLHDPKTAATLFAHIAEGSVSPYALSRAGYWQGRAAEAMGQHAQAKAYYEMAARYTATYYGQIARGRLGLADLGLRGPPAFTPANARRNAQSRGRARGRNPLCARRARPAGVDLCRARRKQHRRRRPFGARRTRQQARRRPRHAAARRRRLWARTAARILRLSDRRAAVLQADRAADRRRRWPIRSRARRATSARRWSRSPMPWD